MLKYTKTSALVAAYISPPLLSKCAQSVEYEVITFNPENATEEIMEGRVVLQRNARYVEIGYFDHWVNASGMVRFYCSETPQNLQLTVQGTVYTGPGRE